MTRILIVDDNAVNRDLVRAALQIEHPDYICEEAEDGMQAFARAQQGLPDLILLDIMMPGMDGFGVCARLKADSVLRTIPVIMITALDQLDDKVRGFRAGAADYIIKPFSGEEIVARVDAHLRIKRYQDDLREMNVKLKQAQDAVVQSARMSAVGSLAAGVAHEFNNILGIMKGHLQLYYARQSPESLARLLDVLQGLVDRGIHVVRGLLNFSRRGSHETRTRTDLNQVLHDMLDLIAQDSRMADVTVDFAPGEIPQVDCMPGRISQVFLNLFNNALDAMDRRPVRRLSVRSFCRPQEAGRVIVEVSDTGSGISAGVRGKIFEPFVTTKGVLGGGDVNRPGTGLGLSICYGIVQEHGGSIQFRTREGEGTTFVVDLPVELPASDGTSTGQGGGIHVAHSGGGR